MAGREGEVVVGLAREGWNQPKVFQGEAARRTTISSKSRAAALLSRLLAQLSDSISFHSSVPESQDAEPKRTEAATGIAGTVPSEENRRVRVCVCVCVFCGCVRVLPGERVSVVCWCVCARSLFYYTLFPALLPPFFSQSHKFRSIAPERIVSSFFPRHFTAASSFFFSFFFFFAFGLPRLFPRVKWLTQNGRISL